MYESYYGFRDKPFSILPDPSYLYPTKKHKKALAMLQYGVVNQAGFTVITGGVGCGKTTLVRELLRNVKSDVSVGLVSNTQCASFEELLRWILYAFDLQYRAKDKVELYDTFVDFIVKEHAAGRRTVLIVDEAQHLGPESLEQLRMLSNVNVEKHQILQLILVGQPDLWGLLRKPELHQFAQRIAVDYFLEPLDELETEEYIKHRLKIAGGNPDLFSGEAFYTIWKYAGGVPRVINLLCDTILVYGMAEDAKQISNEIVEEAILDKSRSLSFTGVLDSRYKETALSGDRFSMPTNDREKSANPRTNLDAPNGSRAKQRPSRHEARRNSTIERFMKKEK